MAALFRRIINAYNYIDHDLSDPRTRDYLYILNPLIMLSAAVVYYKFVTKWGPYLMKNRQPFKLERIMIFYNILQIVLCSYVAYRSIYLIWWPRKYNLFCQPPCFDDTPEERELNKLAKYYYYLKVLDLLDTIFFVFRKKQNQITFLHIYHHLGMLLTVFIGCKYVPVGHGGLLVTINCIVHVCMYAYYLLASIDSKQKKNIWWKKHLTQLQMVQFLIFCLHFSWPLLNPSCTYPKWVCAMLAPQNVFMFVMFYDYYNKEYLRKNK